MKKKEANFELLRVLAMCMIIGLHYLDKGGVLGSFADKGGIRGYLPWIFEAFFFPSVNLYVLISGYFLVEKEVRLKRVWTLWKQALFYSVLLALLAYATGIADIGKLDIYRAGMYLFPVVTEHYWFVTVYILLYVLLPFMNPVLQSMEQKQMKNTLFVLLLFLSVSKSVLPLTLAIDKKGYDILWFLCLYVTGAYLRRFGISWLSGKVRGLLLYAASCMATFGCAYILKLIFLQTGHLKDIMTYSYSYNHIFCYLAAVGLFCFFSSVKISSKRAEIIITELGSATLGVYLLHEHADFRYVWQSWFSVESQAASDLFPLLLLSTMAAVFFICACVEWMRKRLFAGPGKTYLSAGIGVLCLMGLVGVLFDYYYCLNDDAVMRDILCGSYTGVPEGRNIQMLYPLGALISLLYRLFPTFFGTFDIPWYGLFLCGCQYGALFLIALRAADFAHRVKTKITLMAFTLIFGGSVLLYELIFVQYTMTGGILMAAAVFWFYTTKETEDVKAFLKENIVSVLLVVLAFCIRTEMTILLLPFLCGAGVLKWSKEKVIFTKKNVVKYGSLIGAALTIMGVLVLVNSAAYQSAEWKRFHLFFDYRTEIYDFLGIPEYETNQSFYEKAGLKKAEAALLDNYNFALDENIDENVLREIVEYQTKKRDGSSIFLIPAGEALWIYRHSLTAAEYMPFNGLVLFLYLLVVIMAVLNRDKSYFLKIPMLLGIRSVCWLYIIFRNRTPDRITHGLFLVELLLLFSLFATEWQKKIRSCMITGAIACMILALSLPGLFSKAWTEQEHREQINGEWIVLQEYFKEHSENYYVIDVYSTVDYSEKMFERVDNSYRNYDLCGGWSAKSPLYEKKLLQRDIGNLEQALSEKEHVFFVSKVSRGIEWLEEYYEQKKNPHTPEIVDEIELNGEVRFVIYKLL